jgi:hypothetical protein
VPAADECDGAGASREGGNQGRAVKLDSIKIRAESAYGVCNQRLRLKYDKLLSSFAFKFNLRHYIKDVKFSDDVVIKKGAILVEAFGDENGDIDNITVGWVVQVETS